MTLTEAQQAQACPSCRADPHTAPGRSCAPRRCYCAHPECPAAAWYQPRRNPLDNVRELTPKTPAPSAWADREEPTWIDSM